MNAQAPITPANSALAATVHRRVNADARFINARAGMWKLVGIGSLLGLTGVGIGAALFGYSYVADARSSAEKIAAALAIAFDKTTLKTEGIVALAEGGKVALADNEVRLANTKLSLDPSAKVTLAEGGTVGISRGAKVGVEGTVDVNAPVSAPRPTQAQWGSDRNASGASVVTNYTVFKKVSYGKGWVHTGWEFNTNEDASPSRQFCYYQETPTTDNDSNVNVYVAMNGSLQPSTRMRERIGYRSIAQSCVWFDGARTRDY